MIHTKVFVIHFIGGIFDIDPKVIIRPSGREHSRVTPNINRVMLNPPANCLVTSQKPIRPSPSRNFYRLSVKRINVGKTVFFGKSFKSAVCGKLGYCAVDLFKSLCIL